MTDFDKGFHKLQHICSEMQTNIKQNIGPNLLDRIPYILFQNSFSLNDFVAYTFKNRRNIQYCI